MGSGGHNSKLPREPRTNLAMRHDPGEKRRASKATHHQNGLAQHLVHTEVEVRREEAVDLELGLQRLPALPEAREVEIGKLDVLFYLERAVTDKEHMRSVRLDVLHRLSGKAPGLAFQER